LVSTRAESSREDRHATGELERLPAPLFGVLPIYLSPATARTKPIRLHQVWRSTPADEADDVADQDGGPDAPDRPASGLTPDDVEDQAERVRPATWITLRPHDPSTGEEVEKEKVVEGYEYERGQFVTFTPNELKALDVERSKVIDLEMFVPPAKSTRSTSIALITSIPTARWRSRRLG
jgi:Ku70/Ku80 beta-barrel domain